MKEAMQIRDRLLLDRLLGLWDLLVDPRVGIIRSIDELQPDDDEPNFFHYLSTTCDTALFSALSNFKNNGGVSTNRYVAVAKAMGEGIERYCSAIFDYNDLVLARYQDIADQAVAPDQFALYHPEQFQWRDFTWSPFTPDTLVSWVAGRSLLYGNQVLVPAAMVYTPYHYLRSRSEEPIVQPISTGLACGCTFPEAVLSGLCEVVERDAFTLTWQARMSHPRIAVESALSEVYTLIQRYNDVGIQVELMDITTDIKLPTVMSIALSNATTSPAVAVAAASNPCPEIAIIKSLEELAHTRKYSRRLMESMPALPVDVVGGHPNVQDQSHHLRFYCPQESKAFIEFAWASSEWRSAHDLLNRSRATPEEELGDLIQEIGQAGYDVIACDLTTPDIAPLGLSVVRVIVPGLHPLFMGYRNRALGGKRLYQVPQKLRYQGLEPGEADNPYPHPFP